MPMLEDEYMIDDMGYIYRKGIRPQCLLFAVAHTEFVSARMGGYCPIVKSKEGVVDRYTREFLIGQIVPENINLS